MFIPTQIQEGLYQRGSPHRISKTFQDSNIMHQKTFNNITVERDTRTFLATPRRLYSPRYLNSHVFSHLNKSSMGYRTPQLPEFVPKYHEMPASQRKNLQFYGLKYQKSFNPLDHKNQVRKKKEKKSSSIQTKVKQQPKKNCRKDFNQLRNKGSKYIMVECNKSNILNLDAKDKQNKVNEKYYNQSSAQNKKSKKNGKLKVQPAKKKAKVDNTDPMKKYYSHNNKLKYEQKKKPFKSPTKKKKVKTTKNYHRIDPRSTMPDFQKQHYNYVYAMNLNNLPRNFDELYFQRGIERDGVQIIDIKADADLITGRVKTQGKMRLRTADSKKVKKLQKKLKSKGINSTVKSKKKQQKVVYII